MHIVYRLHVFVFGMAERRSLVRISRQHEEGSRPDTALQSLRTIASPQGSCGILTLVCVPTLPGETHAINALPSLSLPPSNSQRLDCRMCCDERQTHLSLLAIRARKGGYE